MSDFYLVCYTSNDRNTNGEYTADYEVFDQSVDASLRYQELVAAGGHSVTIARPVFSTDYPAVVNRF